jgi:hypothetical protein
VQFDLSTILKTPSLLPVTLDLDRGAALLIELSETDYRAASFLDERILTSNLRQAWVGWPELTEAVNWQELAVDADFIFHIGHVGSTLISRLLGEHPEIFSVREPSPLRLVAQAIHYGGADRPIGKFGPGAGVLDRLCKLFSRTYASHRRAVVKTTSFISELAADILTRYSRTRALGIAVSPQTYITTILAGPNSPHEARSLGEYRLRRLAKRLPNFELKLETLSLGELIAMSWLTEASALSNAAMARQSAFQMIDFDRFLISPNAELARMLDFLGHDSSENAIDRIMQSPHMAQYSKAPEYQYDRHIRQALLNRSWQENNAEISKGMQWLNRIFKDAPATETALKILRI